MARSSLKTKKQKKKENELASCERTTRHTRQWWNKVDHTYLSKQARAADGRRRRPASDRLLAGSASGSGWWICRKKQKIRWPPKKRKKKKEKRGRCKASDWGRRQPFVDGLDAQARLNEIWHLDVTHSLELLVLLVDFQHVVDKVGQLLKSDEVFLREWKID